jgi:Matrixin
MNRTVNQFVLVAAMILAGGAASAQEIHLKARNINTTETSSVSARAVARPNRSRVNAAGPVHQIVQFDHTPGVDDIEALMAAGYTVIGAVPDNALMVVANGRPAGPPAGAKWTGELEAGDKISAALESETGIVSAVVEFHADVDTTTLQAIGAAAGVTLEHPAALLASHMIASATVAQLRVLAESDEVAYIFPADPALLTGNELMPCAGMLTTGGTIGQYANIVHGWDMDGNAAHLGYFFGTLTPKVPASTVESEILRALNAWSAVTNVVFSQAASATAVRTIMIEFASGSHGDAYPFDSAGEILAHTFYPVPLNSESLAGDMHFNESVNWHSGSDIDIYSVALHELGHALGLGHTDTPGDVMYPYYRRGMTLSAHDIGAVQTLYGAPGAAPTQAGAITVTPAPAAPTKTTPTPVTPAPTAPAPAPAPVSLTLNAIASPGTGATVSISGTVKGGTAPLSVSWQTDHGYSGKATVAANGTWTATGVTLVAGANTVTATVFDSASKTASESATVTRQQASPTTSAAAPISIHITSPSTAVVSQTGTTISISGTASGGTGVTKVTWQTSGGATGTATGVGPWVASNIPLLVGSNTIIVKVFDAGTDTAWASIVVTRH